MNKQQEKVWIVTGASGGLGLAIVKTLLAHDIRVAAFSRNAQAVEQAVGALFLLHISVCRRTCGGGL